MRNLPDSGFDPATIDTIPADQIGWHVRKMSCEELLTCRILTSRQSVCTAIQIELFARLEVGDCVEPIHGFEEVVKVTPYYILLEGRGRTRYKPYTTGFYHAEYGDEFSRYSCELNGVDWVMDTKKNDDGIVTFEACTPMLEREILSGFYNPKTALDDDVEEEEDDDWGDEDE